MERTRLKQFRVGKKMNQEEFANAIGFTRSYYGKVENGHFDGSMKFWKQIGETFGVPMTEVVELMTVDEE